MHFVVMDQATDGNGWISPYQSLVTLQLDFILGVCLHHCYSSVHHGMKSTEINRFKQISSPWLDLELIYKYDIWVFMLLMLHW